MKKLYHIYNIFSYFQSWPTQIFITYGVSGDLEHNSSYEFSNALQSEDQLMKLFPVPKVLFRIVEFHYNNQVADAAIIIHNDNEVPDEDRICPNPQEGWEQITNDPSTSGIPGLTYACKMTQQVVNNLDINRTVPQPRFFKLNDNRLATVQQRLALIRQEGIVD